MKGKHLEKKIGVLFCMAVVFVMSNQSIAAEFVADYVQNQLLVVKKGTIYVKDEQYRLELDDPIGPNVVFLVDSAANQTIVLYPSYKVFQEMRCDDRFCCLNDSIQNAKTMLKFYSVASEGYDRVAGYICDKQLIHFNNEGIMNRWMSEKLKFPLTIVTLGSENMSTELRNIKESTVDQSLFSIPVDYQKASLEDVKNMIANDPAIKAKIVNYDQQKLQIKEITRVMAAGHEVRVFVTEGTLMKAKVRNALRAPYKWYAMPYKDGELINSGQEYSFTGPAEVVFNKIGQSSNTIVAGASEGEVYMSLELTGKLPMILATFEKFYVAAGMKRSWPINSSYHKLVVSFSGEKIIDNGPNKSRGKVIVTRKMTGQGSSKEAYNFIVNEGEEQTLEFTAEQGVTNFDLAILDGKVKVNLLIDNRPKEVVPVSFAGLDWKEKISSR